MLLSTNVSEPLIELLRQGWAPVDAAEVGPWFGPARIAAYRGEMPGLPFHFHGADLIARVGRLPGAIAGIAAYVAASGSPWASMHVTMWPPGALRLMLRHGWRLPRPPADWATRVFIGQARRLGRELAVPVTLENVEPLPFPGYVFEVVPDRLARVVRETGCGLVLDIGHARVAAEALGRDVLDYVAALPLDRVCQLHVSGARWRGGRWVDAHEPMQDGDYALLDWLLGRTRPVVVTLEYIREREALAGQLANLRRMIGSWT